MSYAEFAPSDRLARSVRCIWTYTAPAGEAVQRIVPDGRCELIVHAAEPYAEVDGRGKSRAQPRAFFAGQVTRPLHLQPVGETSVIGVRFQFTGARPFLGRSLREATDARLPLDQLWIGAGSALARDVAAHKGMAQRVATVQSFVQMHIDACTEPNDPLVDACVARIEATRGDADIPALAADAGLGRRQLERRFADVVGLGPSLLASILRFRSVFDMLQRDHARPWTEAALDAGYYDQSHFIREFRRFVGCTPTEFAREADGLSEALAQKQPDVANVQAASGEPR